MGETLEIIICIFLPAFALEEYKGRVRNVAKANQGGRQKFQDGVTGHSVFPAAQSRWEHPGWRVQGQRGTWG